MEHINYYICQGCGKWFYPQEISSNNGEALKCDECGGQIVLSIHISSLKLTIRGPDPNEEGKNLELKAKQEQKIKLEQKVEEIDDYYRFFGGNIHLGA